MIDIYYYQELVISSQDDDVIDDCLQLIGDYSYIPLTILEQRIAKMKDSRKADAMEVLRME